MKNSSPVIVTFAVILLLIGCTYQKSTNELKPLKAIHVGYMPGSAHVIIAKHLGLFDKAFKEQGADVSFYQCSYGPPMIAAFIGNKIDVGLMGDQPALVAWGKGIDIKAVANFSAGYHASGLVVRDTVKYKSIRDLKGKKVAVAVGSLLQHLLHLYLKEAGMTENDIQVVNFVNIDAITALSSGDVEAAVLSEPYFTLSENKKVAYKIADATGLKWFSNPLVVSGNLVRNHPEVVRSLYQIYAQAGRWILDHPQEATDIVYEEFKLPKEVLYEVIIKGSKDNTFTDTVVTAYKQTIDYLKETNVLTSGSATDISSFYDAQFLDR